MKAQQHEAHQKDHLTQRGGLERQSLVPTRGRRQTQQRHQPSRCEEAGEAIGQRHTEEAFEHFHKKKAFARWDPRVLHDYIAHGTHDEGHGTDKKRVLSFDRAVETAIYNTVPDNLDRLFKRHPVKCPVAFIGGRHSAEMKQVGMAMTERITKGRIMMLDGSHLFPMEKPLATAAAIEAAVLNLVSSAQQVKASRLALDYTLQSYEQLQERFRMNLISSTELLDAELMLSSARLAYTNAHYAYLKNRLALMQGIGLENEQELDTLITSGVYK